MAVKNLFSDTQIKKLKNPLKRLNWSTEDISNGIAIHAAGPRAYRLLRKKKYPLPAISTLRHWCGKIKVQPGILQPVLDIMAKSSLTTLNKICVLSFDEMKIKKKYNYNKVHDETLKPVSYAQVAMIRGLFGQWKQPIFYDFDCRMTEEILFKIITSVENAGFRVAAMVCDLGGSNRGLLKALNITVVQPFFKNPANPQKKIYVVADVPHLLKLVRNHFVDNGFVVNSKEINKNVIEELITRTNDVSDLSIAFKISAENLNVKAAKRQKVTLAAKLFSHTVSRAIFRCGSLGELKSSNWLECSDFFKLVCNAKTF